MTSRRTFLLAGSGAVTAAMVGCGGGDATDAERASADANGRATAMAGAGAATQPPSSIRIDTQSLIAGALVVGHRGLGLTGAAIPATGSHGPGYLYNDLALPADAAREVRGVILSTPSAGRFFAYEDSSFTLLGAPDGSYSFSYRLFVDGSDLGTANVTINIGV